MIHRLINIPMSLFQQFFIFCSGYYSLLLKRCPSDLQKVMGIGATIFFTAVLAALSAGYAFWIIFQSMYLVVIFGVIWGLMIFNLDRFIVSSIRKKDNFWDEFKMAFPRIIFAIFLALVIAKPLELKIFDREIDRKLDEERVEIFKKSKLAIQEGFEDIGLLMMQKEALDQELLAKQAFRDKLQQEYDQERFGIKSQASSGIPGIGTNALKKEQQLDAAEKDLAGYQLYILGKKDSLDKRIAYLEELKAEELEKIQPSIDGFDGLGARLHALHAIGQEKSVIAFASMMVTLLLISLECAPIVVKLLAPKGPYDELLDLTEQEVSVFVHEKSLKLAKSSKKRIEEFEQNIL